MLTFCHSLSFQPIGVSTSLLSFKLLVVWKTICKRVRIGCIALCVYKHKCCEIRFSFLKQQCLTKLSSSGSSLKKGFPSFSWLRTKFSMSTSKLAEVMQSELSVDCSHFSNSRANRGNRGCLRKAHTHTHRKRITSSFLSKNLENPQGWGKTKKY